MPSNPKPTTSSGIDQTQRETGSPTPKTDRARYWRANLIVLSILLSIWFCVSFLFGIILVEPLNTIRIGGVKLGFWFAQQGSIYVFVVLILIYVVVMNRLDARFGVAEDEPAK